MRKIATFIGLAFLFFGCDKNELQWDLEEASRLPIVITTSATYITNVSANLGGDISSHRGSAVTIRGVCYSSSQSPTTLDNFVNSGDGPGEFTTNLTGLNANTTFYARAYATNGVGTAYGNQVNFTTSNVSGSIPTISTTNVSGITNNSAVSGGNVTNNGGSSVTQRGVCWRTTSNPTIANILTSNGSGSGAFTSSLTGLNTNTTYYARAYATNGVGTAYGNQVSFTTSNVSGSIPTISTTNASSITTNSAVSGGNITSNGGATVTQRGVCWRTTSNPTISDISTSNGSGSGSFTSSLTGLNSNTTYYARAYATNGNGTAYGNQVNFTSAMPSATIVESNNCSTLSGISSSYRYWAGSDYYFAPWSISGSGYSGSCWVAPDPTINGLIVGTHYIQFNRNFTNNGFIEFWVNTNNPGYNNVFPTIYIDGIAQPTPTMIGGQLSSFYFMKLQSDGISGGNHTIKIEFTANYYVFKIDEIDFFEY